MTIRFDATGGQINGDRDYQEDAFLITRLSQGEIEGTLVVVADGMGGHAAGNVASNMAVQTFNKFITSHFPTPSPAEVLRKSTLEANQSIAETVKETAALRGMGCTLVACLLAEGRMHWVSVGDSHIYLLRQGSLSKCNADHSYGGFLDRMAKAGRPVEAEAGLSRNMLMSALTGDEIPEIDCPTEGLSLQDGDRLILSSDGLDSLGEARVSEIAKATTTVKDCVDGLLQAVIEAGMPRQDNTTVIAVDILDREANRNTAATFESRDLGTLATANTEAHAVTEKDHPQPTPRKFTPSAPSPQEDNNTWAIVAALVLVAAAAAGGWWLYSQPAKPIDVPAVANPATDTPPAQPPATNPTDPVEAPVGATDPAPTTATNEPVETDPGSSRWTPEPPFTDALKIGGSTPKMVWLPEGKFTMGSAISESPDETPAHEVNLKGFAVSAYEITVAEWNRFAEATRKKPVVGKYREPARGMSWTEATAFVTWLKEQTGKPYRLLSEAEWEYAARARTPSLYWWGNKPGTDQAWCLGCAVGLEPTAPTTVGQFPANPFGLFDTAGNVAEWVQDCYRPNYESAPQDGSAVDATDCEQRVVRGGSYDNPSKQMRLARRDHHAPGKGAPTIGLRIARDLDP